ncbi:MAG: hypothetical protein HXS54_17055 [Theionarchaea archaeon]|nr:hypothetical protein [Theionarchaea archaeon]
MVLQYVHEKAETAFLTGSLVEGFGNALSDLDILVIVYNKSDYTVSPPENPMQKRVDVEVLEHAEVDSAVYHLSTMDITGKGFPGIMKEDELTVLHRLCIGIPFFNLENAYTIQKSIDCTYLAKYITIYFQAHFRRMVEDAVGALQSEDFGTAFFNARSAFEYAVDAYLAFHGETNIRGKWRTKKLLKHDPSLMEKYWKFEAPHVAYTPEAIAEYTKEVIRFSNDLLLNLQWR